MIGWLDLWILLVITLLQNQASMEGQLTKWPHINFVQWDLYVPSNNARDPLASLQGHKGLCVYILYTSRAMCQYQLTSADDKVWFNVFSITTQLHKGWKSGIHRGSYTQVPPRRHTVCIQMWKNVTGHLLKVLCLHLTRRRWIKFPKSVFRKLERGFCA